ncbi:MAG TPA: MbtH domain protein [Candidatus Angelobacter sp.]|jgi:hypothetical protein|nr:MbtH domain protein [Candidatus Angelobacter sp.]
MNELVKKLSQGDHPIEVRLQPERSAKALKECIDRGYVLIRFTDTKGGTELGVRLLKDACNLDADFAQGTGRITLKGTLTLDYVKLQCAAEIDLASLTGQGHLTPA